MPDACTRFDPYGGYGPRCLLEWKLHIKTSITIAFFYLPRELTWLFQVNADPPVDVLFWAMNIQICDALFTDAIRDLARLFVSC
jgi:hypothetical protein